MTLYAIAGRGQAICVKENFNRMMALISADPARQTGSLRQKTQPLQQQLNE